MINRQSIHPHLPHPVPSLAHRLGAWLSSILARVQQHLRSRQARSKMKVLLQVDEPVLLDMGLTRDDVIWALSLPLSVDAARQLERIRAQNRHNDLTAAQ